MSIKHDHQLNFIDVFSGAGGLSCGLEIAGLNCLLGVDIDKNAMKTFALNHKKAKVYCDSIANLDLKKITKLTHEQKIHAVVGGPPCQGFSTVGKGNPNDHRNSLFLHFVRIVAITKPYFIIVENVTGLLAKKNEKTLKAILSQFENLGYTLSVQVLSAHLYGVPEKRRRTIILGSRINHTVELPKAQYDTIIDGQYQAPITVGDVLYNLEDKEGKTHNHQVKDAKIANTLDEKRLSYIPEGKGIRYQKDEVAYLPKKLRFKVDWKNLRERRFRQTKYQRLDRKELGPTIMTSKSGYYHPTENRYLTAREAAKIQSFPNDFIFCGPTTSQWRQIGNAVPPLLGKALGHKILELYQESKKDKNKNNNKAKAQKSIQKARSSAFNYRKEGTEQPQIH